MSYGKFKYGSTRYGGKLFFEISTSDSGVGFELPKVFSKLFLSETGAGSDLTHAVFGKLALDSGMGLSMPLLISTVVPIHEISEGTDIFGITSELSVSDSGISLELAKIVCAPTLSDIGTETCILNIIYKLSLSDSGTSFSIPKISSVLILSDPVIGTDTTKIISRLHLLETGIGISLCKTRILSHTLDSGMGLDSFLVYLPWKRIGITTLGRITEGLTLSKTAGVLILSQPTGRAKVPQQPQ